MCVRHPISRLFPRVWLVFATLLFLAAWAGCTDSQPAVTAADCEAMREHAIDLSLARAAGDDAPANVLAQHRKIRIAANREREIQKCVADMTADAVDCRRHAATLEALHDCR